MEKKSSLIYEFGSFRLEIKERRLLRDGNVIPLTAKVFELLVLLVENAGSLVKREYLFKELWTDTFVDAGNLTVAVAILRKSLGESENEQYIETVPKLGYRFILDVKEISDDEPKNIGVENHKKNKPSENSIALLPLANVSNDPDLQYLTDGVSETIINTISQLPELRVLSLGAMSRYKGKDWDLNRIRSELNVSKLLIGQILQFKNSLIISLELIDLERGWHLWGERFSCLNSNIIEVQETIAQKVSEQLISELSMERQRITFKRYTENTDAYHLYLKGRYFWSKFTLQALKKSIEYYEQAIEIDPEYALAYAGMSDSYYGLSVTLLPPKEVMPRSQNAAIRALSIDDDLSEAHAALAIVKMVYDWKWEEAEMEFKRAIALNPNNVIAHFRYSFCLTKLMRFEEAHNEIDRALDLDPLSLRSNIFKGTIFFFQREYDRAIKLFQKAIEMDPYYYPVRGRLASAYAQLGRFKEAIEEIQSGRSIEDIPQFLEKLGYAYAYAGNKGEAYQVIDQLKENSTRRYVAPYFIAVVYAGLGNIDQAFEWLEKSFEERDEMLTYLKVAPELEKLRDDERFYSLLRRINLI